MFKSSVENPLKISPSRLSSPQTQKILSISVSCFSINLSIYTIERREFVQSSIFLVDQKQKLFAAFDGTMFSIVTSFISSGGWMKISELSEKKRVLIEYISNKFPSSWIHVAGMFSVQNSMTLRECLVPTIDRVKNWCVNYTGCGFKYLLFRRNNQYMEP